MKWIEIYSFLVKLINATMFKILLKLREHWYKTSIMLSGFWPLIRGWEVWVNPL